MREAAKAGTGPAHRPARGFPSSAYLLCLWGIVWREALRFVHQRERFAAALVRPLLWLAIFAAGFRQVIEVGASEPYGGRVSYETYILPGLAGMILLFNGMQSSLSMVHDRETGTMKTLLVSPLPRWFLLVCKLMAGTAIGVIQVFAFLALAGLWGVRVPWTGYLAVLPALVLSGLMLGALGMLLSSLVTQLENFAGIMNFVIFPMYFASSALYPLERMAQAGPILHAVCLANPFTHAVELVRFAFYGRADPLALGMVAAYASVFLVAAIVAYDPARGIMGLKRRA